MKRTSALVLPVVLALTTAVACLGVVASPASAAEVFEVDSTGDGIDADGTDGVCATGSGKCTLRAAITQANETAGNDLIELPRGTFSLKRPKIGGMGPPPNEEGDLQIDEAVSIEGRGAERTVIKQTVNDRVLSNLAGGLPGAQLRDLTITGGRITAPGNQFGGGIYNLGTLVLEGVVVRGNEVVPKPGANSFGGGVFQDDGLLLIGQSTVKGNLVKIKNETGSTVGGGVMANDGLLGIDSSKISGNVTRVIGGGTSVGGGVSFRGAATITNSTISANRAMEGAGIEVSTSSGDGVLNLDSSTVSGNEGRRGGGIYLRSGEAHTISNSTISGNTARRSGSGIQVRLGNLDMAHTTVAGNSTRGGKPAITVEDVVAPPAVGVSLLGSIVANPGSECGGQVAAIEANAQNVFGDATCTSGTLSTDIVAKPRLRDLAKNPGPAPGFVTKTHALKPSSPAIDFVTSGCPPPATDQRGVTRPQGEGSCDAGSFEASG